MKSSGKTTELKNLLLDNAGIIYKLSLMYSNSKEEAEDLRQEISYQVIKSYASFKGQSKISTWVYKVGLFTALTHLRRTQHTTQGIGDIPELIDNKEEDKWPEVFEAVKSLPAIDRSLIFLFLEEKTYAEMAEIMGMTESNIGVRLNRIKKKLKEKIV